MALFLAFVPHSMLFALFVLAEETCIWHIGSRRVQRRGVCFLFFSSEIWGARLSWMNILSKHVSSAIVAYLLFISLWSLTKKFRRRAFSTRLNLLYFFYHKMTQQLCPPERQQKDTYITQIVEKRVNSFTPNFRWGSKRPTLKVRYVVTCSWRSDGTIRWNLHLKKSDRLQCEVCICNWDESGHRESKIQNFKRQGLTIHC